MDNPPEYEADDTKTAPTKQETRPVSEQDPYPKMIIVCFAISIFFLLIIAIVAFMDFAKREAGEEIKPSNPAFFEEFIENPPN